LSRASDRRVAFSIEPRTNPAGIPRVWYVNFVVKRVPPAVGS